MKNNTARIQAIPRSCLPLLATVLAVLPLSQNKAATLIWDAGGASPTAPVSAAGTWNTTNAYWSDGTTDTAWNNSAANTAVFGGSTSYNVALTETVTLGGLISNNASNVTIASGTIKLADATTTTFSSNVQYSILAVNVVTGNSGLTLGGIGFIGIGGKSTYTGATTISCGQVRINTDNALPTATDVNIIGTSSVVLYAHNLTVASLSGTSKAIIKNTTTGNSILTVNGASSTKYNGQLTDTSATASMGLKVAGSGVLNLTAATNSYHGSTTITDTATLKLSTGSNLINTSSVSITGGTLLSALGNINLGVGAVSMTSGNIDPGGDNVVGSFTLAADQNFTATGGALHLDLDSISSFDKIIGSGSGAFSLSSVVIDISSGYTHGSFDVFTGFGGSNTVENVTFSGLLPTDMATLSSDGTLEITAVPEPTTFGLVLGGVGVLLGGQRLRRRFRH